MVIRCFVCSNNSSKKTTEKPISFYGFPTEPLARLNWFDVFDLDPYENVKNLRICSDHFSDSDLDVQCNGRKLLIRGAVPSKNLSQRKSRYKMLKCRSKVKSDKNESQFSSSSNKEAVDLIQKNENSATTNYNEDKSIEKNENKQQVRDCSEIITIVRSDDDDADENDFDDEILESETETESDGLMQSGCDNEYCRELHLEKDKHILILKEHNRRLEKRIEILTNMLSNMKS